MKYSYKDFFSSIAVVSIGIVLVSLMALIPGFPEYIHEVVSRIILIIITLFLIRHYKFDRFLIPNRSTIFYCILSAILISLSMYYVWNEANKLQIGLPPFQFIQYILLNFSVGFFEELLFRFFFFYLLYAILIDTKYRLFKSILFSSTFFGAIHCLNFSASDSQFYGVITQIFYAIAIGIFFQALYIKTHSLILCATAHTLFNFFSGYEVQLFHIVSPRHFEQFTLNDFYQSLFFTAILCMLSLLLSSVWIWDNLKSNKI